MSCFKCLYIMTRLRALVPRQKLKATKENTCFTPLEFHLLSLTFTLESGGRGSTSRSSNPNLVSTHPEEDMSPEAEVQAEVRLRFRCRIKLTFAKSAWSFFFFFFFGTCQNKCT